MLGEKPEFCTLFGFRQHCKVFPPCLTTVHLMWTPSTFWNKVQLVGTRPPVSNPVLCPTQCLCTVHLPLWRPVHLSTLRSHRPSCVDTDHLVGSSPPCGVVTLRRPGPPCGVCLSRPVIPCGELSTLCRHGLPCGELSHPVAYFHLVKTRHLVEYILPRGAQSTLFRQSSPCWTQSPCGEIWG
jgi:hypothetical protein